MKQRIPHTKPTTNSHAAAYGYEYRHDGFGGSAQASHGVAWRHTVTELSSSAWITDNVGDVNQYLQYLPFGESFIDQRTNHDIRFKFTSKERDKETGFDYFGARYLPAGKVGYASDLSIWLSVDPLSDMYPSLSAFMYTAGNPIMLIDPNGKSLGFYVDSSGTVIGKDNNDDNKIYFVYDKDAEKVKSKKNKEGVDQSELNDPIELPSLEQRKKLGEIAIRGKKATDNEWGMLIFRTESGDSWGWMLYKGDESNPENDGTKGSVTFKDMSKCIARGGFGDLLFIIAHTHNIISKKPIPPTLGGDLVPSSTTGIIFETNFNLTYIYSQKTKFRSKTFMRTSVFSDGFIYEGETF
jgi:RHS repeat-associated protein